MKFIFATTECHKIPETILSRCQQYDFRLIPTREIAAHLRHVADADKLKVSDAALEQIARAAEGSARDDNERDPLTFRYAKITDLAAEYGYSDRDQWHRLNGWLLWWLVFVFVLDCRRGLPSTRPEADRRASPASRHWPQVGPTDRVPPAEREPRRE